MCAIAKHKNGIYNSRKPAECAKRKAQNKREIQQDVKLDLITKGKCKYVFRKKSSPFFPVRGS